MAPERNYPETMRGIGVPSEMSPIRETNDAPFVEIREPLRFGESVENSDPSSQPAAQEEQFEIE
ncbi:hypothetical protein [Brevibacillus borstelensis]|uniref:hypothetical protein n=1 Tax=Brevibacillus borstelensis TaxID=45462 RepID=UPI0030C302D8